MSKAKKVIVFAGPNGSGKSTILEKHLEDGYMFICPDNIVQLEPFCNIKDEKQRYIDAMNYAEELREAFINEGISFAFETVFSTTSKLDFIKMARVKEFEINTVFITTKDPEINIERVSNRVKAGGHNVPKDKIIQRYEKSMGLLPEILLNSDNARVYDNSSKNPVLVFEKKQQVYKVTKKGSCLEWVQSKLIKPLQERGIQIEVQETSKIYI